MCQIKLEQLSTTLTGFPTKYYNEKGEMQRPQSSFRDFISNSPGARFPPAKGRYHLYVSYACPWGK